MKHPALPTLLALAAFALATPTRAADSAEASLHLKQKDVEKVVVQMEPDKKIEVRVSISKAKLDQFLSLTEANLNKPIAIYLNEKLVTAPVITKPFIEKVRYLTLKFADFDSAAQVAHGFMPAR